MGKYSNGNDFVTFSFEKEECPYFPGGHTLKFFPHGIH